MNADEIRLLWARHLAAELLSPDEQRALTAALEDDAELREALLDDLDLDGALRGLSEGRRRADALLRTMADIVAPERDATRFVRKVEEALAAPSASKPPSSTKLPAVRATHRFTRRAAPGGSDAVAWKVGVAAAALFALVIGAAVARPSKPPVVSRAPSPAPLPLPVEEAPAPPSEARKPSPSVPTPPKPEAPPLKKEGAEFRDPAPFEVPAPKPPGKTAEKASDPARRDTRVEERVVAVEAPRVALGVVWETKPTIREHKEDGFLPLGLDLKAHEKSGASLVWKDGTWIRLQPGATFRLGKDAEARRVQLDSGMLDSQIARQELRPMIFETPHAEAVILGTTIRLTASSDASIGTTLEVKEGRVTFARPGGKPVEVAGGHFAVAATGVEPRAHRLVSPDEEIRFVFGPADTRPDARHKLDSGAGFDPARGYGWKSSDYAKVTWNGVASGHVGASRNTPSKPPEPQRSGHVAAGWGANADTWTMPIPNGRYWVTVGVGDWSVEHGPNRVTIEDRVVVNDVITRRPAYYAEFGAEVVVKDGELTMVCGGTESKKLPPDKSLDTILNYLVIRKLK